MSSPIPPLQEATRQQIHEIFNRLNYQKLGDIYCDEGGEEFWNEKREPCQDLGLTVAHILSERLKPGGHSLYVGAGVAELPLLIMETVELKRKPEVYNLRCEEVTILNEACTDVPVRFECKDARLAKGTFDHLWIVSVLNDPEHFPELSALSYGCANPVIFDTKKFYQERQEVETLVGLCLEKISLPGLVTTSVEEIPWVTSWCEKHNISYVVEEEDYPTAIVEDPLCFIQVGRS